MKKNIDKKNKNLKKGNNFKKIINKYKKFFKENILTNLFISIVLMILIFCIVFIMQKNRNIDYASMEMDLSFFGNIKSTFFTSAVVTFAGIVPYCYISFLGFILSADIANIFLYVFATGSVISKIFVIFSSILQIIGYSFCVSAGFYYCKNATKRFKYSQGKGFSYLDVKKGIYAIRKNEEKYNEIVDLQNKKLEKLEKNNVKIDYFNIIITTLIGFFINVIALIFV